MAWLLVSDRLVWVFQKLPIYWDFHTDMSRVYREWSEKEKISSERQFSGRKCLVDARDQRRMARLVRGDRKAAVTQIKTCYVCRRPSLNTQRTTAAEDHNGCHWGYNSHKLTKLDDRRLLKSVAWSDESSDPSAFRCYQIYMDQSLWGMFPAACSI